MYKNVHIGSDNMTIKMLAEDSRGHLVQALIRK